MRRLGTVLLLVLIVGCRGDGRVPLDDPAAWTAHPADGVALDLSADDGALRMDFQFTGGGYAIARRDVDLELPANYMFRFRIRGEAPVNDLEFKLVDDSGQNVWWQVRRDVAWPDSWQVFTIKKRQISFAWGPQGESEAGHIAAIEFAITAGDGGQGTVWIDDLEMLPLPAVAGPPPPPAVTASSKLTGHEPAAVLDGDITTWWSADASDPTPELDFDFQQLREYGGLTITWVAGRHPAGLWVETSDDGRTWQTGLTIADCRGTQSCLYLPETESQRLRLHLTPTSSGSPAIAEIEIQPLAWSATREAFLGNIARHARRGLYPRGFLDEPTTWTVVGVDRDPREGLLGDTGALEVGPGAFSLEPFLWVNNRLVTWNDVTTRPALAHDYLPIPSVTWTYENWRLTISAMGMGPAGASSLLARYRLENAGETQDNATLYVALRPFQVNPPVQFLNIRGGTAPVQTVSRNGNEIIVDGRVRVRLQAEPTAFGATSFSSGDIVADYLQTDQLPATETVDDAFNAASAAAAYQLSVAPGETAEIALLVPLYETDQTPSAQVDVAATTRRVEASWQEALNRVTLSGPPAAHEAIATLRAQLGAILVNRAGVGIQPGVRSYARSWIRDGALTGVALLRLDQAAAVRDFLNWYAPHQYENGKVPCVVDTRGADPVPEHDSTGEFIHLVTEYYRYTGDREALEALWPRIVAGVEYLDTLLDERRTPEYETEDQKLFYGILPPSISHEGYAAKPMHSYWDDFFALRGLKDAAWLASEHAVDGHADTVAESARLAKLRDRLARDLGASVSAAMARHNITYVPGCADLGDFDATSTTIALDPAAAVDILPPGSIDQTFERYWTFFIGRANGEPWDAFTPYEVRSIGAFVRLGHRDRAQVLLQFFLDHRTPRGWRQWPEVVVRDTTTARFIGDMPHTWVGSDFIRSFLDMFAYEQRDDVGREPALVLAAGVPATWLSHGGVYLSGLPTPFGKLGYRLRQDDKSVLMEIEAGVKVPGGGLLLDPPTSWTTVTIDGVLVQLDASGRARLDRVPARVEWRP